MKGPTVRVASERDYELHNGDSSQFIADDAAQILATLVSACGEGRPVKVKIMFDLEADGVPARPPGLTQATKDILKGQTLA